MTNFNEENPNLEVNIRLPGNNPRRIHDRPPHSGPDKLSSLPYILCL